MLPGESRIPSVALALGRDAFRAGHQPKAEKSLGLSIPTSMQLLAARAASAVMRTSAGDCRTIAIYETPPPCSGTPPPIRDAVRLFCASFDDVDLHLDHAFAAHA